MTRYLSLAFCGIFAFMCLVSCTQPKRSANLALSRESAPGNPEVPELSFMDGVKANEQIRDEASFGTTGTDYGYDVLEYNLSGHFDWTQKILVAEIEITFQVSQPLREIVFDSRVGKVFRATDDLGKNLDFQVHTEQKRLLILLPKVLSVGESKKIRIFYETRSTDLIKRGIASISARPGDPVTSRVVYTFSEPTSAQVWMPCHDTPSDRAIFQVQMQMSDEESLISNGRLLEDKIIANGVRRMSYRTDHTLPTYLMAFAMGELNHIESSVHGLPLSVWGRRGARIDYDKLISVTRSQIKHFESLLGAYPWEKYALVLLPDFRGGIEHASISFVGEDRSSSSNLSGDIQLMAHELSHQWFGDYVTIRDWMDLWIKEGMATLLTAEYMKFNSEPLRENDIGAGDFFWPKPGEPMIAPILDYNSGPYDRAAWVLTQVREILGEVKFWEAMRELLRNNAFGSVSSEEVLAHLEKYSPVLDKSRMMKVAQASALPNLKLEETQPEKGGDSIWTITIEDPERTLLNPLSLKKWLDDRTESYSLSSDTTLKIVAESRAMLALDIQDTHPRIQRFISESESQSLLEKLFLAAIPKTISQKDIFSKDLSVIQSFVMSIQMPWPKEIALFFDLSAGFKIETTQYLSLMMACRSAEAEGLGGVDVEVWREHINKRIAHPPYLGLLRTITLAPCEKFIPENYLSSFYELMSNDPTSPLLGDDILFWMSRLPPEARRISNWQNVALRGYPYRSRLLATQTLARWAEEIAHKEPHSPLLLDLVRIGEDILANTTVPVVVTAAEELLTKAKQVSDQGPVQVRLGLNGN
ncbi:MAG: hypothetical protein JNM39_00190 [Bdellovibrionaceae bacterium]|nr:hypothetical protein [Pseudobdellovibrionaceae bacterium]